PNVRGVGKNIYFLTHEQHEICDTNSGNQIKVFSFNKFNFETKFNCLIHSKIHMRHHFLLNSQSICACKDNLDQITLQCSHHTLGKDVYLKVALITVITLKIFNRKLQLVTFLK